MIDETAARELDLYAENTSELYGQFKSIIENVKQSGRDQSGVQDRSAARVGATRHDAFTSCVQRFVVAVMV